MMKKIAALIGAGALLLSVATPTFAWWWGGSDNTANVNNGAEAVANTGGNSQSNVAQVTYGGGVTVNGASGDRTIYTGDANAYAGALVVANTHVGGGSCVTEHDDDVAVVGNGAGALADTGLNAQDDVAVVTHGGGVNVSGGAGTRYLNSGAADSTARAWTIVNTHVDGF